MGLRTFYLSDMNSTLAEPVRHANIPAQAQWLSGEGAGSWFLMELHKDGFYITRFSPEGKTECKGIFNKKSPEIFDINREYRFTYISHCSQCTIIQDGHKFPFFLKGKV